MKVLVAGASGLVGREVLALLKQRGHYVRTVSKHPERAARLSADDVRVVDATDRAALAGVCRDIDVVVSTLGAPVTPSGRGKSSFGDVDGRANLHLLSEAAAALVRRFVYLSVYTRPAYASTAYVTAHTDVEAAVRASGLEHGFVRTTGIFGSLAELLDMARKGSIPLIGEGTAQTNPVDERDVAEALVELVEAEKPSDVELGGPEALTRRQIVEAAFAALERPARVVRMPVWLMRLVGAVFGVFNRRMGQLIEFVTLVSTNACVAPTKGKRRLDDYFRAQARGTAE